MLLAASNDILAVMNFNRATECMMRSDFPNALIYLNEAIQNKPDDSPSHWNKAMCLLSMGHYFEGFEEFEYRWGFCDWPWVIQKPNINKLRRWKFGELDNKRVLLVHDGGRGDAIMMLRFIPRLQAMGARLTLLMMPEVRRLGEQFDVEVITEVPDLSQFDIVCPMFSLLYVLGENVATIPSEPYLKATPRLTGRRIGVCWSGVSQTSLSLQKFLSLAQIDSIEVQALQPGPVIAGVEPLPIGDFQDLAEIMMGLDHILTVDTAAANLAGALGHPSVHLLLRTVMDFRWWRVGAWYPLIKTYRQKIADDWTEPFAHLRSHLNGHLAVSA